MGALGTLGIGLSVLFGLFLVVLAGEIYYLLCSQRGRGRSSSRSVQVVKTQAAAAVTDMRGFAREATMVGSFGGNYPTNQFVSKFFPPPSVDCTHISPFHGILFTIAEETKEEMELHTGNVKYSPDSPLPANLTGHNKPVVDTSSPTTTASSSVIISLTEVSSACESSTSVSFSVTPEATPFATPPSSPSASDTSSDGSLSSMSSQATAASRFSAHDSFSPASASASPPTAVSHFSLCSVSPSLMAGSPATANSRFNSVTSPVSIAVSTPAVTRCLAVRPPVSTSAASHQPSIDASYVYGDHGPLGALFRRPYNAPSRYTPLRPVVWSGQITDFRHARPYTPQNAQVIMNC